MILWVEKFSEYGKKVVFESKSLCYVAKKQGRSKSKLLKKHEEWMRLLNESSTGIAGENEQVELTLRQNIWSNERYKLFQRPSTNTFSHT